MVVFIIDIQFLENIVQCFVFFCIGKLFVFMMKTELDEKHCNELNEVEHD